MMNMARLLTQSNAQKTITLTLLQLRALALVIVVNFYKDTGLSNLIVEGDVIHVVNLLKENLKDWSQGGVLVAKAKSLLNSYTCWSTTHVRRTAKQAAHLLAREAAMFNIICFNLEHVSQGIRHVIVEECML